MQSLVKLFSTHSKQPEQQVYPSVEEPTNTPTTQTPKTKKPVNKKTGVTVDTPTLVPSQNVISPENSSPEDMKKPSDTKTIIQAITTDAKKSDPSPQNTSNTSNGHTSPEIKPEIKTTSLPLVSAVKTTTPELEIKSLVENKIEKKEEKISSEIKNTTLRFIKPTLTIEQQYIAHQEEARNILAQFKQKELKDPIDYVRWANHLEQIADALKTLESKLSDNTLVDPVLLAQSAELQTALRTVHTIEYQFTEAREECYKDIAKNYRNLVSFCSEKEIILNELLLNNKMLSHDRYAENCHISLTSMKNTLLKYENDPVVSNLASFEKQINDLTKSVDQLHSTWQTKKQIPSETLEKTQYNLTGFIEKLAAVSSSSEFKKNREYLDINLKQVIELKTLVGNCQSKINQVTNERAELTRNAQKDNKDRSLSSAKHATVYGDSFVKQETAQKKSPNTLRINKGNGN